MTAKAFNPLDKKVLATSVAEALLNSDVKPLGGLPPFVGAGIYAIYYTGDFPSYAPIAEENREGRFQRPIYVGKAVPKGRRKGKTGIDPDPGNALFERLSEHAESVQLVANLSVDDFWCRYLLLDDIWISLGEALMIARFAPIWNNPLDGFGNHDPGGGRYNGKRPRWDVVHPGRPWASKCAERKETAGQLLSEIEAHLRTVAVPGRVTITAD